MSGLLIGSIIPDFPKTLLHIERGSPGSYVKGRFVPGSPTFREPCHAVVHPATGREQQLLPEDTRSRETIAIYSEDELRTVDQNTGTIADRVIIQNRRYEVVNVEDWSINGGFYKALAVREVSQT